MADSTEVKALLLQISANTELLKSNLSQAEQAVKAFHDSTQAHLDDSDKRFAVLGKSLESLEGPLERLKSLGEVAVGALLGESLLEKGKQALEFAGNIQFMANQIGVSTDFLQKFNYAAGQYGISTEVADTALTKFTRTIGEAANGNKELVGPNGLFTRLGVNIRDSGGNVRSVTAIYDDFANSIQKLDSPAQRTADTMTAMGRGAAGLAPLAAQGAEGFNALAQAAEQLGIVLSPELIEHSEEVNHKLSAMKQIIDAQMASVIATNAVQIENLATALIHAAGATAHFLNSHPQEAAAILGAMAGARLGGLPGAAIGALGGAIVGKIGNDNAEDANNDLTFRLQKLHEAQASLRAVAARDGTADTRATSRGDVSTPYSQAKTELAQQIAFTQRAMAAPREAALGLGSAGAGATNDNGDALKTAQGQLFDLEKAKVGASGASLTAINGEIAERQREIAYLKQGVPAELAKSLASKEGAAITKGENDAKRAARDAEEQRKKAVEENLQFEAEQLRLQKSIVDGKAHTVANDAARDALEKQIIDETAASLADQIKQRRDNVLNDPKASQDRRDAAVAHANILLNLNEQDRVGKDARVDLNRAVQNQKDAADKTALDLQGQIDLVGLQDQLAVTRQQRLTYELQLLDLQRKAALKAQQDIIDSKDPNVTDAQRADAKTRQDQINAAYLLQVKAVQRQDADPLQAYALELHKNTDDMNDALKGVAVDGLKSIEDGFAGVISGTETVAQAFRNMASSILSDLAKLAIEKALVSVLGLSTGGPVKGYATGGQIPAYASGGVSGLLFGPGTGTSDSILARLSTGEFIMNAASTKKYLPVLHAMNDNRLPGFADGGEIGLPSSINVPRIVARDLRPASADRVRLDAHVNVTASPEFDARMTRVSVHTVAAAADPIMAGAQARTTKALTRRVMPGGYSG